MFYHTGTQQEYPNTDAFKLAFPNTSFGQLDNEPERNATDLYTVYETPPEVNELYAYATKDGVEFDGEVYRRKWKIEPWPKLKIRQNLFRAITEKRKQVETGGITFPNGMRVATGIDDQNRITSVIGNAELAGVASVDFKAESGWISLTLNDIRMIAAAIALHVQACFSVERQHYTTLEALPDEELLGFNFNTGWPGQ